MGPRGLGLSCRCGLDGLGYRVCFGDQGDGVSMLLNPISHVLTPVKPIFHLLTKSP